MKKKSIFSAPPQNALEMADNLLSRSIMEPLDSDSDTIAMPQLSSAFDDDLDLGSSIFSKTTGRPINPSVARLQDTYSYKAVRLSNGGTFNLKRKFPKATPSSLDLSNESSSAVKTRNYYGVPIHKLLSEAEELIDYDEQQRALPPRAPPTIADSNRPTGLLCEKWRPDKWVDLLGPEKTHRQLLKWLLSWSHAVFKTETQASVSNNNEMYNDPFNRPQRRILLIHGPPGIGKTTVAHVIAKHAGYDILEINASDERSGPLVKDKIKSAVATHRVGGKPVCIIADEIEGAAESVCVIGRFTMLNQF